MRPAGLNPVSLVSLEHDFGLRRVRGLAGGDPSVSGITIDGSSVVQGDLYVGLPGARHHGASFAGQAIEAGAVAILTDDAGMLLLDRGMGVPVLVGTGPLRPLVGALAASVYDTASLDLPVFAVTGTNGKTSTTHFLEALLTGMGLVPGVSSTAERRIGATVIPSKLTTPESAELHAIVARMAELGARSLVIEVSAHALTRHRVDGFTFDVAAFTNLSHDHLDDYADMDAYLAAKVELFTSARSKRAVVNLDTPAGATVVERSEVPVATIATVPVDGEAPHADWIVEVTEEKLDHTAFTIRHAVHGSLSARVPVVGRHMAANGGLAIAMLVEAGHSLSEIARTLGPNGLIDADLPARAVRIPVPTGPAVFIDSGHSPDAFEKTLSSLRRLTTGRLVAVIGANGDRDTTKRGDMGAAAALGADTVVVTDHHPRGEDPATIRRAVVDGATSARPGADVRDIADPSSAIRAAVAEANEGDIVVWMGLAGKDHRELDGTTVPFSVPDETIAALHAAGWH
ncbi:UDP-N-acetylmuramoylalanyl-D-glutamate--2,6-diaminopimelate ligase [Labedella gwakjiensis]|uniref:UDP-N-acetylmuramoyl-L-alanyl-D-glutamate--2, 6-diaminopimelate ligase n=2 Tax=Labedella gwakjiensis TaxID=390269 RepID=A0A2P8GYD3_9MICO|nr:UDP-N-acetylmuramoylalanyl-D-glutamate--2,6-diaminopimelate ligase [Labedella gwakjiensis]RUQ87893.1 UDP-N-acetylmuramoyl-L-alanyl-D-glutamate--2,6-diaminopimelate ligase [Labedella gwakjiensis]